MIGIERGCFFYANGCLGTYTERDVRLHINRLRDLLAGPYKPNPSTVGIDPALSFYRAVTGEIGKFYFS
jgi:hypothetical protein